MNARLKTRAMSSVHRGFARAGELNVYYERVGTGRPLLLLHAGFSTIDASFGKLRPAFVKHWATIAVEQQGHGHTADIDRPMSYRQMVDDTAAVMRTLEISDADVFGWSDGGIVALGLAIEHPKLTRKVAIMGAGYNPGAETPEFRDQLRALKPDNEHLQPFHVAYKKVAPDPGHWPTLIDKARDMYFSFEGWQEADLRRLEAPLLVMLGDQDFVRLEHAVELFRMVPQGRLAVLPGSDHGVPVARAEWVAAMLQDFFNAK